MLRVAPEHLKPTAPADLLVIVTPVFDDWGPLRRLVAEIETEMADSGHRIELLVVDDCSSEPAPERIETTGVIERIELLRLAVNVGHQRAIAVGLVHVSRREDVTAVAVMDSDGEDTPAELRRLALARRAAPGFVHVAERSKRSETRLFRTCYWMYGRLFKLLTGKSIRFGNFSVMPFRYVRRIATEPSIWNNYAATMIKSRIPVVYVPTTRGVRYAGQSKMNFVGLVLHGLGAISVFSESVFVRILLMSGVIFAGAVSAGLVALFLRLFTDLALPNWATTVLGFSFLISFQAVMMPIMIAFLLLNNRSAIQPAPKDHALALVEEVRDLGAVRALAEA